MMTILVTGADGFIGSNFVKYTLQSQPNVHLALVCSWRRGGVGDRLQHVLQRTAAGSDRVTILTHDLNAPFSHLMREKIGKMNVTTIVNFAAESHVDRSIENPADVIQNNVMSTVNMLELARGLSSLSAFFQISTDEVYGPAVNGYKHKEWDAIIPSNPYAASKASQEAIATSYWRTYGVPVIITNTMNNIGPMQSADKFLPMVIRKVIRGETVGIHAVDGVVGSRFYLHAENHADAIFKLINSASRFHSHEGSGLVSDRPTRVNVVGEREVDNLTFAKMIAKELGRELNYELVDAHSSRPGHDLRYALDDSLMKDLGWSPPVGLEKAVYQTVNWYKAFPQWLNVYIE